MTTKRIAVVVTCVDSWLVAEEAIENLRKYSTAEITEIILVDNGSWTPIPSNSTIPRNADRVVRFEDNWGGNSVCHRILPQLEKDFDIIACFHNDLMMVEEGWDQRVADAFDRDPKLALVGLVGSNEIDMAGGRGLGTTLSYMGNEYRTIWASRAEIHGARTRGLQPGGVTDHCGMIFRRSMLEQLPAQYENGYHTPGHFYDRIICCEIIERGWHIANIGLECDHASGGVGDCGKVPAEKQWGLYNRDECYKKWLTEHNIPFDPDHLDIAMYKESERRYLGKWRDEKHFIPFKVFSDYSVMHTHPLWKS